MNSYQTLASVLAFLVPVLCSAFSLPGGLTSHDRKEITSILGFNSGTKFLSNPYPLGGYSGFEIGLSIDVLETKNINLLGDQSTQHSSLVYPRVNVAKGLYNNVDISAHFTPFTGQDKIFEYGALLKWSFYQAEYLPISLSLTLHGNTINIGDLFVNSTVGADLIVGLNFESLSFYFGGGHAQANSRFASKVFTINLTDTGLVEKETLSTLRSLAGIYYLMGRFFVSGEMQKYKSSVYAFKVGLNF